MTRLRFPFSYQTPVLRVLFSERRWEKRHRQAQRNGFNAGDSQNHSLLRIYSLRGAFGCCSVETLVAGLVVGLDASLHWFGIQLWLLSAFSQVTV